MLKMVNFVMYLLPQIFKLKNIYIFKECNQRPQIRLGGRNKEGLFQEVTFKLKLVDQKDQVGED